MPDEKRKRDEGDEMDDFDPMGEKPKRDKDKRGFSFSFGTGSIPPVPPIPPIPPVPPVPPMGVGRIEFGSPEELKTYESLRKLYSALMSLGKTTEHALLSGQFIGIANSIRESYESMFKKIIELLPDDEYVIDILKVQIDHSKGDEDDERRVL